ncbi:MAG: aminomethyltransferase, partial [Pseudomonadota bacterium]
MLDDHLQVRPGPPKASVIVEPRVFSLPRGTERYVVEGAGAILVQMHAGDHFTITNDEGAQRCELVPAASDGKISPELLGQTSTDRALGLQALVTGRNASLHGLALGLTARDIDLNQPGAITVFGEGSPAGDTAEFTATGDGTLVIAAPGGPMDIEA